MNSASTFLSSVADQYAARINGRDYIDANLKELLNAPKSEPIPESVRQLRSRFLGDDNLLTLQRVYITIICGIFFAIPGYWIMKEDFMSVVGNFYASQPNVLLLLSQQLAELVYTDGWFDSRNNEDYQEAINYISVTVAYSCCCTAFVYLAPLGRLFLSLEYGLATWTEFVGFWTALLSVIVTFKYSGLSFRRIWEVYQVFRSWDRLAQIPRNLLIQGLFGAGLRCAWYSYGLLRWTIDGLPNQEDRERHLDWLDRDHVYKPLQGDRHIRILRIPRQWPVQIYGPLYGLDSSPGSCRLEHWCLDDPNLPPYECISYTWGRPPWRMEFVEVDGHCKQVNQNVYNILCERRRSFKDRFLWIDSICINQSTDRKGLEEKTVQVPLMKDIYSKAQRVVIHLGDLSERSDTASARSITRRLAVSDPRVANELAGLALDAMFGDVVETPEWKDFLQLLSHPFFGRVWVVQEVAVASSLDMIVGDFYLPWLLLNGAIRNVFQSGLIQHNVRLDSQNLSPLDNSARFLQMVNFRTKFHRGIIPKLSEVLIETRNFDASVPQDKIFAVIGISDAQNDSRRLIDYTLDLNAAVCRVAEYLIAREQYFDVIHEAGIGWSDEQCDVPSWVPDWTARRPGPVGFRFLDGAGKHPFSASRGLASRASCSSDYKVCTVRGIKVGTVCYSSETLVISTEALDGVADHTGLAFAIMSQWWGKARKFIEEHLPVTKDRSASARDNTFLSTLVAGRDENGAFVSPEFLRKLHDLEKSLQDLPSLQAKMDSSADWTPEERIAAHLDMKAVTTAIGNTGSAQGARLAMIEGDLLALVPKKTAPLDEVWILSGATIPVLLRRKEKSNENSYHLVGTCYVQGIMFGDSNLLSREQEEVWLC